MLYLGEVLQKIEKYYKLADITVRPARAHMCVCRFTLHIQWYITTTTVDSLRLVL
jgi:hypothetical protein